MSAIEALLGKTTRRQLVLDYPANSTSPGLSVSVIRMGSPNADMSDVDVTDRFVAITFTAAGPGRTVDVHMDADHAYDVADALEHAAHTIRREAQR